MSLKDLNKFLEKQKNIWDQYIDFGNGYYSRFLKENSAFATRV